MRLELVPTWAIVLILLMLANLGWVSWNLYSHSDRTDAAKQFRVAVLHTNDVSPWPYLPGNASAVGIVETKTGQPVWVKWNLNHDGNLDIQSICFRGEKIFDIYWTNGRPPVFNVYFRDSDKGVTWWQNRFGASMFTERTLYDTNGVLVHDEVWCSQAW